jgi:hypothetical protein
MFSRDNEKVYVDKVLAKDVTRNITEIIKKSPWTRTDVNEILNLMATEEAKLLNYEEYDRYHINKFFVWIRDFALVDGGLYDNAEKLEKNSHVCECGGYIKCTMAKMAHKKEFEVYIDETNMNECKCEVADPITAMDDEIREMNLNSITMTEHMTKFLIDLYLNLARTTLSLKATGFIELLQTSFKIDQKTKTDQPRYDLNTGKQIA